VPSLKAWAESLGGISYPLLSDFWPHGKVAEQFGVLRSEGYTERAIFVMDREGVIRYIDIHDIDLQPDNEVLFAELVRIDPEAASRARVRQDVVELPRGGIVMYCTKWCPDCRRARAWLQEQNREYLEVDIYATPGALQQVRKWGGGRLVTPTFDINGTILLDFDEDRVKAAIGE
jgi:glutaredoxin